MKKYKIFIWNAQCSAGTGYGNNSLIPYIIRGIEKEAKRPDIIILTEFYKFEDYDCFIKKLKDMDYVLFEDKNLPQRNYNQVFIAISNNIEITSEPVINFPEQKKNSTLPNFMSVILEDRGVKIAIIGTRIRWNGIWDNKEKRYKITKETFELRKKEFNELINLIKDIKNQNIKNIIIGGDFNNGRIRGNRDDLYDIDKINYPYKGYDQENYNFHVIKNELAKIGFKFLTPKGYSVANSFALDHIAIPKDCNMIKDSLKYVKKEGSDHKALVADIEL